jgi:hypothetical protein
MQRSDYFAVFLAIFGLGAGAILSTFPAETIRGIGLILMAAAIVGIIIWFAVEHRSRTVNAWGPWILIIGGSVIGALWLYLATPQLFGNDAKRLGNQDQLQNYNSRVRHLNNESKERLRIALRLPPRKAIRSKSIRFLAVMNANSLPMNYEIT